MKNQSQKFNIYKLLVFSILMFFCSCTQNNTAGADNNSNISNSPHTNADNVRMPSDTVNKYRNKSANTGDAEADHNTSTPGMPASATPAASGHK